MLPLPPLAGGEGWGEGGLCKNVTIITKFCTKKRVVEMP